MLFKDKYMYSKCRQTCADLMNTKFRIMVISMGDRMGGHDYAGDFK